VAAIFKGKSFILIAATKRVGLIQVLALMTQPHRGWMVGALVALFPLASLADEPRTNLCLDSLCFSTVENGWVAKDRTYYQDESGLRHLVVRFSDGGHLSLLLRPIKRAECPFVSETAYASKFTETTDSVFKRGCLGSTQADRFFRADLFVYSPKTPVTFQVRTLNQYIQVRSMTRNGFWSGPTYDSNILLLQRHPHER
jgi:hypothetical protein